MSKPKVPKHLSKEAAAWFRQAASTFVLEDHHLRLLRLAAEAWDRGQEARQTLAAEGSYYRDRFGTPKAHPAVAVERDARLAFARMLRELDLDGEPAPDSRPPAIRSNRR